MPRDKIAGVRSERDKSVTMAHFQTAMPFSYGMFFVVSCVALGQRLRLKNDDGCQRLISRSVVLERDVIPSITPG